MLDLQPGEKVLDVGCGIGGGDFYMAEKYDVHVVGIDLSVNIISLAFERAIGRKCVVEFEVADCTVKTYPEGSFDVIYSRDTILHIQVTSSLFIQHLISFTWLFCTCSKVICFTHLILIAIFNITLPHFFFGLTVE